MRRRTRAEPARAKSAGPGNSQTLSIPSYASPSSSPRMPSSRRNSAERSEGSRSSGILPRYSTSASPSTRRAMRPHRPPAARGAPTAAGTLRVGTPLTSGDWRRFASTRRLRAPRSDGPPRPRASSPPGILCRARRIRPRGTSSRWATRTGFRSRITFRSRRRCRRAPTRRITPTANSTDTRTWTCARTTRTLAATVACTAGPRVLI
mmetsp:Transcript_7780/g.34311  ORF Transcript_7780/g.34311 Transcript_7780/m.34311 type:complete len:207 (-) Transcript_7780:1588-2208(-)